MGHQVTKKDAISDIVRSFDYPFTWIDGYGWINVEHVERVQVAEDTPTFDDASSDERAWYLSMSFTSGVHVTMGSWNSYQKAVERSKEMVELFRYMRDSR